MTVTWATASEIDNAGFNIYRSTEENGTYTKINSGLIPAKGSPSGSATYQFTDKRREESRQPTGISWRMWM